MHFTDKSIITSLGDTNEDIHHQKKKEKFDLWTKTDAERREVNSFSFKGLCVSCR